jgi:hypothetical protein
LWVRWIAGKTHGHGERSNSKRRSYHTAGGSTTMCNKRGQFLSKWPRPVSQVLCLCSVAWFFPSAASSGYHPPPNHQAARGKRVQQRPQRAIADTPIRPCQLPKPLSSSSSSASRLSHPCQFQISSPPPSPTFSSHAHPSFHS